MKSIALGIVAGGLFASAASAALQNITVSPTGASLSTNAPDFTFNGIRTSDFSSINLTSSGANSFTFTEHGFLPLATFDPGNFTPNGLNGSGTANPYGLYLSFTGSGSISGSPGLQTGSFSTLSYSLLGDPGFNDTFDNFDAGHQVFCIGCGDDVTLANGTLLPGGTNTVILANANTAKPSPAAFVDLLFNGTSSSFFITPPPPFSVALDSQFSNTGDVTNQFSTGPGTSTVTIGISGPGGGTGGSGSAQVVAIPTPEPASLMLVASGLLGVGLIRRRSRK